MNAGTSGTAGTKPHCGGGQDYDHPCDCQCPCPCDQAATSDEPVRYFNGQKSFSVADLASGGLGAAWGHTRQYNNRMKDDDRAASFDMGQGYNWLIAEWPYARPNNDGSYLIARGTSVYFFEPIGGGQFSPWFGIHQKLEHDVDDHLLRMTDPDGHVWELNDFESLEAPGMFRRMTTPGGQTVEVTAYEENKIGTVERASGGQAALERYQYEYATAGANSGRLEKVTLQRRADASSSWNDIRRVVYSYYEGTDTHGSLGDLKTATEQTLVDSVWTDVQTHYYRYWKDSAGGKGFQHGLKYSVGPEAFARLATDPQVTDPLTADDSIVAQYADLYLEYDAEQRITKETLGGGSRTYSFIFEDRTGGFTHAYNHWFRKTTETRPDGSETIVYTNHLGQVLLREFSDGAGGSWYEHWQLDEDEAHAILHAHPSAVDSYTLDAQTNELSVSLKANDGLIEVTDYYSSSGNGAADGRVQHEKIKQGELGTEIKRRSYEYASHTGGGRTVNPISKETVYRNEDGTGAIETSFSYTFHSGTVQIEERVTTLPAIPTSQNGSGTSNTRTERFDAEGNLIWTKGERDFIHRNKYDASTGALVQTIQDVDTTQVSDEPSGWSTPSVGGKHIVTDMEHDDQGRVIQELGPEHEVDIDGTATNVRTATWTVYIDVVPGLPTVAREVRTAQGYATGTNWDTFTLVNPVSITKLDQAGRTIEEIQATRASTSGKLSESDTFAQSSYVRWSTNSYDDAGILEHSRVYHTIPSSGAGSSGTNYDQTTYAHDSMSRQNMVKSPGGTITRTVFSSVGWVSNPTKTYVGTDDTSATESDPTGGGAQNNNMVLVSESQYDNGNDGGDSRLTKQTEHVDSSTKRETSFTYDWRGRQTDVDGEEDFYQKSTYDNLGHETRIDRHDTTSTGNLIARSETNYDDLGRVYQTKRYAVDVSTGTVGNSLTDNTWFDEAGDVIKEKPAGSEAFTKYQYDSLGRQVKQFIGFDVDETSYADALNVTGDTIFEQSETDYDDASNFVETRLRRRHHDATGTGELTTPSGGNPKARVSYVAHYSDAMGRQIAGASYGTNGDSALSRSSTIPTRSDDILVTTTEYNDDGEAYKTIDPANKEDRTEFDDAGRVTKQIENYTDGDPTTGGNDEDITVEFTYTADGQQATITAKQKSSSDDQTTKYIYGTSLSDSDIARSDLLRAVIYPDSDDTGATGVPPVLSDGADSTYDRVEHKYNRQGEVTETKDQNETVHVYDYDKLGRQIHDRVTTLGTNIDGAVRRISTTYEVHGQIEKITSHDNATVGSGNVVNEVLREYIDSGLLDKEYQEHDGAKDANTLYVGYNYDESASGGEFDKGLRQQSIRYPDGRLVHYTYGASGSDADNLNRLDAIKDDNSGSPGDTLASHT